MALKLLYGTDSQAASALARVQPLSRMFEKILIEKRKKREGRGGTRAAKGCLAGRGRVRVEWVWEWVLGAWRLALARVRTS